MKRIHPLFIALAILLAPFIWKALRFAGIPDIGAVVTSLMFALSGAMMILKSNEK